MRITPQCPDPRKATARARSLAAVAITATAIGGLAPMVPAHADGGISPQSNYCPPGWASKFDAHNTYKKKLETDVLYNNSEDTITRKVRFEKTATSKWSVSAELSAELKAGIFASVKAKINAGVDKTNTIKASIEDTVKIRARRKLTSTRGWRKQKVTGHMVYTYSNCTTKNGSSFTFTSPYTKYIDYKTTKL